MESYDCFECVYGILYKRGLVMFIDELVVLLRKWSDVVNMWWSLMLIVYYDVKCFSV